MKYTANIITSLRIAFAIVMVFQPSFSTAFWICYVGGGISDMVDGLVARKLNQQSSTGAKLDSIADMIFALALFIVVIKNIDFPDWIWLCGGLIALLRMIGYLIGLYKYKTFSSLHTYANKATGALIFAFPLLYYIMDINIVGIILCVVAFLSSLEELIITVQSKELKRDCKSFFIK